MTSKPIFCRYFYPRPLRQLHRIRREEEGPAAAARVLWRESLPRQMAGHHVSALEMGSKAPSPECLRCTIRSRFGPELEKHFICFLFMFLQEKQYVGPRMSVLRLRTRQNLKLRTEAWLDSANTTFSRAFYGNVFVAAEIFSMETWDVGTTFSHVSALFVTLAQEQYVLIRV